MSRPSRPPWPPTARASVRASRRPTHAGTGTRPTLSPRSHGVSTRLSGSWRPTSGRPPVRRPAPARDGLPGAANHDRKGGVMSSPTHVEREQTFDVAVDPRLSRGVKAFLQLLNAAGGPPLETLPPLEARAVLVNAQA